MAATVELGFRWLQVPARVELRPGQVSVQRDHTIGHGGETGTVDLSSAHIRVLFEHAAIADYRWSDPDAPLLNA